jgi:hypothetical protein
MRVMAQQRFMVMNLDKHLNLDKHSQAVTY